MSGISHLNRSPHDLGRRTCLTVLASGAAALLAACSGFPGGGDLFSSSPPPATTAQQQQTAPIGTGQVKVALVLPVGDNDVARVDKDADWLKRRIRYEVVTAAYGEEIARQVLNEGDAQWLRAVQEIPKAKAAAEDYRRARLASSR